MVDDNGVLKCDGIGCKMKTDTKMPVWTKRRKRSFFQKIGKKKVPPRLELGLLDSESNVLTTRPWDQFVIFDL